MIKNIGYFFIVFGYIFELYLKPLNRQTHTLTARLTRQPHKQHIKVLFSFFYKGFFLSIAKYIKIIKLPDLCRCFTMISRAVCAKFFSSQPKDIFAFTTETLNSLIRDT